MSDDIKSDPQSHKAISKNENVTDSSKDSSTCSETHEDIVQSHTPNLGIKSSENLQSRPPIPSPSLLSKFVKRVAICTAVVAVIRYTYPKLLKLVEEPEIAVAEDGLFILGKNSFAKHIEKGSHFIKFYAPWCGHCKKMAPAWDELAKDVDGDKSLTTTIAKVDCTAHQSVCQEYGVGGYPTIKFFRDGKEVEQYRGGRAFKDLKDYVISMKKEKAPEEEAEDAEPATVPMLTGKNFEESIKTGTTFVKFFAPWCGHCKKLAPTWEDLGAKYKDNEAVTIAKVDCTAAGNTNKDLCDGEGVKGFPTLQIYKDGKKITEYNGKRGLEELDAFVKEHSGAKKDEL